MGGTIFAYLALRKRRRFLIGGGREAAWMGACCAEPRTKPPFVNSDGFVPRPTTQTRVQAHTGGLLLFLGLFGVILGLWRTQILSSPWREKATVRDGPIGRRGADPPDAEGPLPQRRPRPGDPSCFPSRSRLPHPTSTPDPILPYPANPNPPHP